MYRRGLVRTLNSESTTLASYCNPEMGVKRDLDEYAVLDEGNRVRLFIHLAHILDSVSLVLWFLTDRVSFFWESGLTASSSMKQSETSGHDSIS